MCQSRFTYARFTAKQNKTARYKAAAKHTVQFGIAHIYICIMMFRL